MVDRERRHAVVVGAGFYGLKIALYLRESLGFDSVMVLEREHQVMERASRANQARVHNGYHYPRSILTGYRSRVNVPTFTSEYRPAIVENFDHYYAIAADHSKVNPRQFALYCERIGAPIFQAEETISAMFNQFRTAAVFKVVEPAFDYSILRDILLERIDSVGGIDIHLGVEVESVSSGEPGELVVSAPGSQHSAAVVISAVYSQLNELHRRSALEQIALQHEVTEMALVRPPPELQGLAVTVMDGPFFSFMPYPSTDFHTLSHVRYTPHGRWFDGRGEPSIDHDSLLKTARAKSTARSMIVDASRYVPLLARAQHVDSVFEIKTVLSKSESNDSRPILFRPHHGLRNYVCVMGGKLDNIYDVLEELTVLYGRN